MSQLSNATVGKLVRKALKAWTQFSEATAENSMADLLLVKQQLVNKLTISEYERRLAANTILNTAAERLRQENPEEADILKARYMDNATIEATAEQFNVSEDTISRRQKSATDKVIKIVYGMETAARDAAIKEAQGGLAQPTYTKLFGVAETLEILKAELLKPSEPWIVAVVGIGGLGKTAVTDKLAREMIGTFHFHQVLWVRVESAISLSGRINPEQAYNTVVSELFAAVYPDAPALPQKEMAKRLHLAFRARPYLVIIDNLEEEAAISYLVAQLQNFINPSKFVLTTRARPAGQGAVFSHLLEDLNQADTADLLRYHARERNLQIFAQATDDNLAAIFEVTGGNPFALKLVIGLLERLPLKRVLEALRVGQGEKVAGMYERIYKKAWEILSEEARAILLMMPAVSTKSGAPAEMLQMMSGLDDQQFWAALNELISRSLMEVRHQSMDEVFYGVHALTETFVRTSIVQLREGTSEL